MKYSVVNYSTVLENGIKRLEAEFYNSTSSLSAEYYVGEEIIDFVQYGTSKELNEIKSGFPTLRLNEFESFDSSKGKEIISKFNLSYVVENKEIDNTFIYSVRREKNNVYDNGKIRVWDLD